MVKIYLYAGYYELFITDKPMPKPYVLLSWHRSVPNAERAAEKYDEVPIFAEHLLPESWAGWLAESFEEKLKEGNASRTYIDGVSYAIF